MDKTATARGRRQWREDAPTRGTTELSLFDLPEPLPPHPALHEVLGLTLPEPSGTPATEAVRGVGQAWAEEPAGATAPRAGGGDGSGFVSDETEERKRGVEEACGEGREDADAKPGWRPPRLMLMGSGGGGSGVGGGGGGGGLSLFGGAADEWEEEAAHGRGGERGGRPMVMVGSQAPVGRWTTEGWEEEEPIAEPEVPSTLQQIPPGDLTRVQELGRGQFGAVWHQRWRGVDVAVKEMHNAGVVARTEMVREAATLATLRHPCVVGFYGVILSDGLAATVLEFVRHGNLRKALKGRVRRDAALMADPAALRRLRVAAALSAARGMEYLHSQSIVHFDLKVRDAPSVPLARVSDAPGLE